MPDLLQGILNFLFVGLIAATNYRISKIEKKR